MPLHQSPTPLQLSSAPDPHYLIFFASGEPPWCPDCVNALPAIHAVFGTGSTADEVLGNGPIAYMIRVGEKPEWRSSDNHYRKAYSLTGVPSIIRWENGKETARLVEEECFEEDAVRRFTTSA